MAGRKHKDSAYNKTFRGEKVCNETRGFVERVEGTKHLKRTYGGQGRRRRLNDDLVDFTEQYDNGEVYEFRSTQMWEHSC